MKWVSVNERLPRLDWPTLLWGDKLGPDDFPLPGRLCGCHGRWLSDTEANAEANEESDTAEGLTERLLGTVTQWLEWEAPDA